MPNLNHRLYSTFFPIFSSQKSAFFPPFFLPNPNGQLDLRWQNARNTARRMALRTMGFLVALFSTTRADAVSITSVCKTCAGYGGAICDYSSGTGYDDGTGVGNMFYACITSSNHNVISDSTCVSLLKSWGMCNTYAGGVYYLNNSALSCAGGTSNSGTDWFSNASATCNYNSYTYQPSVSNYYSNSGNTVIRMSAEGTGASYLYALCTIESGGTIVSSGAYCCLTNNSSADLSGWLYSGSCTSGYTTYATVNNLSNTSGTASCTTDFQDYFRGGQSTGYCTGSSIYVEGTGALLIAQACYGASGLVNAGNLQTFCGVVITSCRGDNGFYHRGISANPLTYDSSGGSYAFCAPCPDGSNNNVAATGILTVQSSGTGISSCYGIPTVTTVTESDDTGTYKVNINGNCPYKD